MQFQLEAAYVSATEAGNMWGALSKASRLQTLQLILKDDVSSEALADLVCAAVYLYMHQVFE